MKISSFGKIGIGIFITGIAILAVPAAKPFLPIIAALLAPTMMILFIADKHACNEQG